MLFDVTEWIDRDYPQEPVRRYSYQVRYCNGLRSGVLWQYRLDYHPLSLPTAFVPHHHDQAATDDEHTPVGGGRFLTLAEALPLLEQHLFLRVGPCGEGTPGFRGRAPHLPPKGAPIVLP